MKAIGFGAAALAAALMVSTAWAAGDAKTSGAGSTYWLGQFDTNKDGNISRDEFDTGRNARFKTLDANGDGTVSQAERQAAIDVWYKDHPNEKANVPADQMKDLSANDFNTNTTSLFDKLDTNKDGMVSQAELDAMSKTGSLDGSMM